VGESRDGGGVSLTQAHSQSLTVRGCHPWLGLLRKGDRTRGGPVPSHDAPVARPRKVETRPLSRAASFRFFLVVRFLLKLWSSHALATAPGTAQLTANPYCQPGRYPGTFGCVLLYRRRSWAPDLVLLEPLGQLLRAQTLDEVLQLNRRHPAGPTELYTGQFAAHHEDVGVRPADA
jgi:hypothetical protein